MVAYFFLGLDFISRTLKIGKVTRCPDVLKALRNRSVSHEGTFHVAEYRLFYA